MRIYEEMRLHNFKPWSGAVDTFNNLTSSELDSIEDVLEDIYPEGCSATQINDILWFEDEFIEDIIGRKLFDDDDDDDDDE